MAQAPDNKPEVKVKVKIRLARTTFGGRMVDPFTKTVYGPEARIVVDGSWFDSQLEAKKIEIVEE